ncbi:hypothetical protein [Sphingobium subterraneum]|uniref:Uncharacterized protein n=1 Tax=Sphingobium subterraneum TaxID=627688 RepID=A0A841J7N0_9SPHN|nr:hypothetical protein [Sphingobium subterraneum]MBB6124535.1 hypothetical protein [Sphingobium subterraneum]
MKGLLKLAFLTGIGTYVWKSLNKPKDADGDHADMAPVGSSGVVRNAGPEMQKGIKNDDWDVVDEQVDGSFPASDPPANY